MKTAPPPSAPSGKRLVIFVAFIIAALATFTFVQLGMIQAREREGREALAALFDRKLATQAFRVSPGSQDAFILAELTHGPAEARRLVHTTYILPTNTLIVEATTLRRNSWFRDRFEIPNNRKLIENYTCTPLPLSP
jgi:uncharacterized PurR-regulated membrane protein YhhQ (DUF165 family)